MRYAPPAQRRGFTLVEMLMVVSIMFLVLALSIPVTKVYLRDVRETTGINTVTAAAAAARSFADRDIPHLGAAGVIPGATYDGTAILFTPSGELRLIENNQTAKNTTGGWLEPGLDGFVDIAGRDYIKMPTASGVVGIARRDNGGSGQLVLLAPPFAIRFDRNGQLMAADLDVSPGGSRANWVHYDGSYDTGGEIDPASDRDNPAFGPATYDPETWIRGSGNYDRAVAYEPAAGKHRLPFDAIESVIGVIVYSRNDFLKAEPPDPQRQLAARYVHTEGTGSMLDPTAAWLLKNGKVFFFNRFTGAIMKDWQSQTP